MQAATNPPRAAFLDTALQWLKELTHQSFESYIKSYFSGCAQYPITSCCCDAVASATLQHPFLAQAYSPLRAVTVVLRDLLQQPPLKLGPQALS